MTWMAWARFGLVAAGAALAQVSVLDQIVVNFSHPDVLVELAAAAGIVLGAGQGAIMGFVLGLFADLFVSLPFGMSSLTFVLLAFGTGLVADAYRSRDRMRSDAALCVVGAGIGTLGYGAIGALIGQPGMLGAHSGSALLVVLVGAIVLAWPCLWLMQWSVGSSALRNSAIPTGGSALE